MEQKEVQDQIFIQIRRIHDLPNGTRQTIVIDVRGQNISRDMLREIKTGIDSKTNGAAEIIFKQ